MSLFKRNSFIIGNVLAATLVTQGQVLEIPDPATPKTEKQLKAEATAAAKAVMEAAAASVEEANKKLEAANQKVEDAKQGVIAANSVLNDAKQNLADSVSKYSNMLGVDLTPTKAAESHTQQAPATEMKKDSGELANNANQQEGEKVEPSVSTDETPPAAKATITAQEIAELKAKETSHIVKAGSSMSVISAIAYSRPGYWRILKLHNGVAPEKLQAGQTILAPDLNWLLADSQFSIVYPEVAKNIMEARQIFMDVEDGLAAKIKNDTIAPTDEDKEKIASAIDLISKSRSTLNARRKGVRERPSAAILQLRSVERMMAVLATGTDKAASKQNLLHEHLSNSIVYASLWARNGFK